MRLFAEFSHRFLLLHLFIGGFASIEMSEVTRDKKVSFVDESSTRHYFETTTSSVVINDRKHLTSIEALPRNDTDVFKPSVHLGEIEQPRTRTNPFNNVQHVRFDNNVQLDTRFQDVIQGAYRTGVPDEATLRPSRIRFRDDDFSDVVQTPSVHRPLDDRRIVTESSRSRLEDVTTSARTQAYVDPTLLQNVGKPETQDTSAIFGKLTSDHRLSGHPIDYIDVSRSPYVISYYTTGQNQPGARQPQEIAYEMIKKPEGNDVIVVEQQESSYTRKHKFPYQFYQPGDENLSHDVVYVEEPHYYPRARRTSPWKKIIHLIGTFLPLGLLLATLTPNIVRINSTTTQPPIVLSKLRAADLPVEHKQARRLLDDESTVCEDRSVCELILAGGEPQSNILQNILWNLATRTPDNVAERNGLGEMFGAVKKKNCMAIGC